VTSFKLDEMHCNSCLEPVDHITCCLDGLLLLMESLIRILIPKYLARFANEIINDITINALILLCQVIVGIHFIHVDRLRCRVHFNKSLVLVYRLYGLRRRCGLLQRDNWRV